MDKELLQLCINELLTKNIQLIINERFENLKPMNPSDGLVFKLNHTERRQLCD